MKVRQDRESSTRLHLRLSQCSEAGLLEGLPFVITLDASADPPDVKATVTGPDSCDKRVQFVMVNIGVEIEDWRIQDIRKETSPGSGIYQSIFT